MRKNLCFYILSVASCALFALLQIYEPEFLHDHIESKTFDLRLNLRNLLEKQPFTEKIAIVVIDEKSIAEIGRWPWSRTVQADLIDKIASGKPAAIGIDIMYSESESPAADKRLADAIKRAGNVVQATAFITENSDTRSEPAPPPDFLWDAAFMEVKSVPGIDWKSWAVRPEKVNVPVEVIAKSATLGHVANVPDMDGVLRWDIMYVNYGDDCYPSLPLQVARVASKIDPKSMVLYGGSGIQLGDRFIKTDISGRVIINYRGKEKSFLHIPAVDLLNGKVSPQILRDRIILVGTSALATFDQKVTPFSANFPGVEKNANVVHNILNNDFITKSPGFAEVIVIFVTTLLLVILTPRLKAKPVVMLGFGLISAYFLVTCYLMVLQDIWMNIFSPTANMILIVTAGTVTRLLSEEKQSRQIRAMFSSYVTERLVTEMIKNPEMARLGGEKRVVSILFSDVKSFTTYSENHTPEEVVAILNEYLGEMTRIILKWDGILDKFIGDAIVAFWGAPMKQEDHARRAVLCALEMQERLAQLKSVWEGAGKQPLSSGIGLNTGEAIVGNIGAEGQKMDYTIIGDQVNLGARVESLTRRYDASVLMTEYMLEHLKPLIADQSLKGLEIRGLERVIVKGKDTPVGIYSVKTTDPGRAVSLSECDPDNVVKLTEK